MLNTLLSPQGRRFLAGYALQNARIPFLLLGGTHRHADLSEIGRRGIC